MTNKLAQIKLGGFIYDDMPKDVVSVDILFKDEPSPNIYIVDTISPNDAIATGSANNVWDNVKSGGLYEINSEAVNSVVPSNQLLRPWDNVPRRALAQDITGSRVVYGNYVQNYNLNTANGNKYFANFEPGLVQYNDSISGANKSIKSLREYQLGVVFIDEYGRETPVISNPTGTIQLGKEFGDKNNRLKCRLAGQDVPQDLTYYKFFIKETSNEYYNMAMDRWYDAQDGNIWLAFPSSDRNKLDIDTFLILKKGTDSDDLVTEAARYKVLAIEAEAPDYIKSSKILISSTTHSGGGGAGNSDIFSASTTDAPLVGENEFKMNFKPFHSTSAQNLDTINEDLYVQFGKVGSSQLSGRYRISSITSNWDVSFSNTAGGLVDVDGLPARYSIRVEQQLGEDVNFLTDSPANPLLATKIDDGAIVFVYKYVVENKPQFDGRFFVKIHNDDVFKNNIARTFAGDLEYRVGEFRRLYGMKEDHVERHTSDVRRFLINDYQTYGGNNDWDQGGNVTTKKDWMLGYYLDDHFSSFALYFRRYLKEPGNVNFSNGKYSFGVEFNSGGTMGVSTYSPDGYSNLSGSVTSFTIRHLGPALTTPDVTYNADQTGQKAWQKLSTDEIKGFTARWRQLRHFNAVGGYWANVNMGVSLSSNMVHSYIEDFSQEIHDNDQPQKTSVWFIDMGPSIRESTALDNSLFLDSAVNGNYGSAGSPWAQGYTNNTPRFGSGVVTDDPNDRWDMEIGFGGIEQAENSKDPLADFFNVGDWFTPSGLSSNLNHSSEDAFVQNISSNLKFKFKEDKDQTIYTIVGSPQEIACIRHSFVRHELNATSVGGTGRAPFMSHGDGEFPRLGQGLDTRNIYDNCKAEMLSFNFTKNWNIKNIQPKLLFNPTTPGIIGGSGINNFTVPAFTNPNTGNTCDGASISDDLKIYVETIQSGSLTLHVGMALHKYTKASAGSEDTLQNHLPSTVLPLSGIILYSNEFLVIRDIVPQPSSTNIAYYELLLGGYTKPMKQSIEHLLASSHSPQAGSDLVFVQVGMNGYSHNSEFNINTIGKAHQGGCVGAVGYTLEFVKAIDPEPILSENPAIWETEPKEIKDLDVYYEASPTIPMKIDASNVYDAVPVGSVIQRQSGGKYFLAIDHFAGGGIIVVDADGSTPYNGYSQLNAGNSVVVTRPDGLTFTTQVTNRTLILVPDNQPTPVNQRYSIITLEEDLYTKEFTIPYHNCYSFGNGVESNRIRDNFNLPFITNGVRVSTTLEEEYKEERRK